jgi:arylsulfatase A-like enzyme
MVDDQLRRFCDFLEAEGVLENTLVVFVADHGDYVGDYGLQRKGAGLPEVLMRIPFVVSGPGVVARDDDVDHVSLVDLLPTLCEAVGAPVPAGVQGRSLWPLLTGQPYPEGEFTEVYAERGYGGLPYGRDERPPLHFDYEGTTYDELNTVTQSGFSAMLREGDWKVVYDLSGNGELYDLSADPMELDNLWDSPAAAAVRARLTERLLWWRLRVADDLPEGRYTAKRAERGWVVSALDARPAG